MARGSERGFTLLEVLVAMTILGAGIAGLMGLLRGSIQLSGGARDVTTASLFASQRLEEALLIPKTEDGDTEGAFDAKYRWKLSSESLTESSEIPVEGRRFRVVVSWEDGAHPRSLELSASRWQRKAGTGG